MTDAGDGNGHEVVVASSDRIEFRFEKTSNLIEMKFLVDGMALDAEDAAFLIETCMMLGRDRTVAGFLVDCSGLANAYPGWRATIAKFFQLDSPMKSYVAWYDTTDFIRVTVEMFAIATPAIEGRYFTSEAAARAWLREQGIR